MSEKKLKITHRAWVVAALLLALFTAAIEITIVATAMPRIVSELGGFGLLSWVFSAYLLTQVVSIPIYGKLADIYGRKPLFITGIIIFLVASVLCGLSQNMLQLIAFRFLQGIGGGGIQPIAVTIIGDLFESHERHKVQGWTGSLFAAASLIGPTLGAFIVDVGHWSWIFYLNIPLGILSILLISLFFHEEKRLHEHKIDSLGASLLVVGTSILMLGLLEGGTQWEWFSWQSLSCFAAVWAFSYALLKVESKAKDPVIPLWIFKHKLITMAGIATFLNGVMMIGYSAMIPTHVQGVLGESALVAGLALASMSIGWPLASILSGRVMRSIGYRRTAILGGFTLVAGALGVLGLSHSSALFIGAAIFVSGMGLGLQSNAYIITLQSSVPWKERGVVTANNLFMRTLGSAVGVAFFGGVLNSTISKHLGKSLSLGGKEGLDKVNELLHTGERALSSSDQWNVIDALSRGMNAVFLAAVGVALVCLFCTLFLPKFVEIRRDTHKL